MISLLRALATVSAIAVLSSCGGGGGGGSGNSGDSGATSLVPAPAPLGATLASDATTLRPLRDTAEWSYHGTNRPDGGAISQYYTATVRHRASGAGVSETESDVLLGDGGATPVSASSGVVSVQATDPFGIGGTEVVTITELRSPVRVNDQYTQLERKAVPLGVDIDADGTGDVADIALYAKVVGAEDVALPELGLTLSAVRVDVTALIRPVRSSDGQAQAVLRVVQSTWYAAGVGVIRRTLSAVTTQSADAPVELDETLFSWDGVTQGLGALEPKPVLVPVGILPGAGSVLVPSVKAAARVGDIALLAADSIRASDPSSLTLVVLDKRGNVQALREHPGLWNLPANASPNLHAVDDSSALLSLPVPSSAFGLIDLRLQRVGADAQLTGSPALLSLDATAEVTSAWTGQVLWVGWRRQPASGGVEVVVRPFSAEGAALAPEQILDSVPSGGVVGTLRIVAQGGRALVTWVRVQNTGSQHKYAVLQGAGAMADVRTLGSGSWTSYTLFDREVVPLLSSGVAALAWRGPVFSDAGSGPLPDMLLRGVTLDGTWAARRSTLGGLDDETLPAAWADADRPILAGAQGDRLVVAGFGSARVVPQLPTPSDLVLTASTRAAGAPWVSSAASATTARALSGTLLNINLFGQPRYLVIWDDRALVFGDPGNRTMVSLAWLR